MDRHERRREGVPASPSPRCENCNRFLLRCPGCEAWVEQGHYEDCPLTAFAPVPMRYTAFTVSEWCCDRTDCIKPVRRTA